MSTEEGSESKELLRLREAVLVLTQEQRVQEQNSRQREFFDTFDLGAPSTPSLRPCEHEGPRLARRQNTFITT